MSELSKAVGQLIANNLGMVAIVVIVVLSWLLKALFKIHKKEIDPLKWIFGKIGEALTRNVRGDIASLKEDTNRKIGELRTDLDNFETRTNESIDEMKSGTVANCETLKRRLDEMEAAQQRSNDMQTIQTIRAHILDFANSCFNKRKHTKQEFENIINENAVYEELIQKYDIKNNIYKEDYGFVMKCYHKCQEEGTFLKEGD